MPAPARTDHASLGVQAHPTRGAKFNLSSSIRRPPRRAVAGDLDVRIEPDVQPLVEVAVADPDQHGMTRLVGDGQPLVDDTAGRR